MPNVKRASKEKTSEFRLSIAMGETTKKKVEQLAREESRSIAQMLRILVERGLATNSAK